MTNPLYDFIKNATNRPVKDEYVRWRLKSNRDIVAKDDRGNEYRKLFSVSEDDYVPRRVDYKNDVIDKIFEALQGINGSVFNLRLDVGWFNKGDVLMTNNQQIIVEEDPKPMFDHFHYVARKLR